MGSVLEKVYDILKAHPEGLTSYQVSLYYGYTGYTAKVRRAKIYGKLHTLEKQKLVERAGWVPGDNTNSLVVLWKAIE